MEVLQEIILRVLIWLGLIRQPDYLMQLVSDHPDHAQMQPGLIYVVGGRSYQKWAYFLCPTGNGELIQLSLQAKQRPRWEIRQDFLGRPTVYPSVRQLEGSFAHFWIRSGQVVWCEDSGRRPIPSDRQWQA
jgi:hypothetical protein